MLCNIAILELQFIAYCLCSAPTLLYRSSFPVHANSTFQVILTEIRDHGAYSVIRVEIISKEVVHGKALIYPGVDEKMEVAIANPFFWIENWFKDSSSRINILLRLHEVANGLWLCVSYREARSIREKILGLREPCAQHHLLMAQVGLTVDPQLDLSVTTKDGRTDGVYQNDLAKISCISKNGVPPQKPRLSHPSSLALRNPNFFPERNMQVVHFLATVADHGKVVSCSAGRSYTSAVIRVFHNPTEVHLRPSIYTYLPNGSSVECISSNGYPNPTVSWIFISGPPKASSFYHISPSNNLTIFPQTPIGSTWTFNCSSINSITASYDAGIIKTYKFIIYPVNKAATIITAVVICGGLIFLAVVVAICNRHKLRKKTPNGKNSRSTDNKDTEDDNLNNLTSSYYTYPTISNSPNNTVEPKVKKHLKKSRKNKLKPDSDIYEEENIV